MVGSVTKSIIPKFICGFQSYAVEKELDMKFTSTHFLAEVQEALDIHGCKPG